MEIVNHYPAGTDLAAVSATLRYLVTKKLTKKVMLLIGQTAPSVINYLIINIIVFICQFQWHIILLFLNQIVQVLKVHMAMQLGDRSTCAKPSHPNIKLCHNWLSRPTYIQV